MKSLTYIFSVFFFFVTTIACESTSNNKPETEADEPIVSIENIPRDEEEQTVVEDTKNIKKVEFLCKDLGEDEDGKPQSEVYLKIDDIEKKVASITACNVIDKQDFDRYEIPSNAIASCGGWFAGAGDYFYAIMEVNEVVVYQCWVDEGDENDETHWEKVDLE